MYLIFWYILGIVGVCIISHIDGVYMNEDDSDTIWLSPHHTLLEYLIVSLAGILVFIFALCILPPFLKRNKENK